MQPCWFYEANHLSSNTTLRLQGSDVGWSDAVQVAFIAGQLTELEIHSQWRLFTKLLSFLVHFVVTISGM